MKQTDWTDERGRRFRVLLPDGADAGDAALGVPVGPPDIVDGLGLPPETATRLHNELHARGLWGVKEARRDPQAVFGALQAALKVDTQGLLNAYAEWERDGAAVDEPAPRANRRRSQ